MYPFSPYIPASTSPEEAILLDERFLIQIGCLLLSHLCALRHGSLPLCLNENSSIITFARKLPIFGEEEAQFKSALGGSFSLCSNFEAILVAGQTRCLEVEPAKHAGSGRFSSLGKLINSTDFGLMSYLFWSLSFSVLPVSSIPINRTRIISPVQAGSRLTLQPGTCHICLQEPPSSLSPGKHRPSSTGILSSSHRHQIYFGPLGCRGTSGSLLGV